MLEIGGEDDGCVGDIDDDGDVADDEFLMNLPVVDVLLMSVEYLMLLGLWWRRAGLRF